MKETFICNRQYFICTNEYDFVGNLIAVQNHSLIISQAVLILDSGNITKTLLNGEFIEINPFAPLQKIIINRRHIIFIAEYTGPFPLI